MFDAAALRGHLNTLTVNVRGLTAEASVALLVRTANAARDRVLGGTPRPSGYRQVVDGAEGAPLTAVRPDGVIVFAWQYFGAVVTDTYRSLVNRSPRDSGEYIRLIRIFADGQEVELDAIPADVREVRIVATADYARRLEVGRRKTGGPFVRQVAPRIVEETAIVARRLYGDLAAITFGYVDLTNARPLARGSKSIRGHGNRRVAVVRYPAILIRARTA